MTSDSRDLDMVGWLAVLRASGRSSKTLVGYEHHVHDLYKHVGHPLAMVTRAEAIEYSEHLGNTHRPAGRACYLRSIKSFYNWLIAEEVISRSPFKNMTVTVQETAAVAMSRAEIDALIAKARTKRDKAILTTLADTGARKGEIASLRIEDIDFDTATLYIRQSKTRPRPVAMKPRLIAALTRWLRYRGTADRRESLWGVGDPYSLIGAVVKRVSADTVSPHDFRKAFACHWLEDGGSEIGLQRVCGWTSNAMVKHYTMAKADELALAEHRRLMAV